MLPARLLLLVLLGGCAHVPKVTESTTLGACAGASITPLGRPLWATTADIDRDGEFDILLLDIQRPTATASVVPLRASAGARCQDASIAVPITVPPGRRMRIETMDVNADGHADLVVWNQNNGETAVLHGTGAAPFFRPAVKMHVPDLEMGDEPSRERWDSAELDARGRLYVTSPDEAVVARVRRPFPPPTGRNRVATPFAADYAVYVDFAPDRPSKFRTLVIGAGRKLAIQEHRHPSNYWRVLHLR